MNYQQARLYAARVRAFSWMRRNHLDVLADDMPTRDKELSPRTTMAEFVRLHREKAKDRAKQRREQALTFPPRGACIG